MSEQDEDFASTFQTSIQAKRVEKGQTIEGTLVGIGSEVAFVEVGGKGEAVIEIAETEKRRGRSSRTSSFERQSIRMRHGDR
jgi:ribosomal protein S1